MDKTRLQNGLTSFWKDRWMYLLLLPGIVYYVLFAYKPMWGVFFAFQNYSVSKGFTGSPWVGFEHFHRFFTSLWFGRLFRNTIVLALLNLVFFFPAPIILALLLNEVRNHVFKRAVQSLTYLPHFLSWVVIVSIFQNLLTLEGGVINEFLKNTGHSPVPFLQIPGWFRPLVLLEILWKEIGWGTIIFLAALASIDVSLYEAAIVDGASHWDRLWHITLPSIKPTIIVMLILRLGSFMNTGFEQIYLMTNSMNRDVAEVFDTYVYRVGVQDGQFSYSTAVGLFKSVIGLALILISDRLAKKVGEDGIL
ncbi:MAG: ABC transporter permease subunit [Treponema sp.]|jgi:putative aldouronate transport system permease protein|nr:ABC transporter permease subunit [Treponema sp.]